MHRRAIRVYSASISSDKRVDPIVVDVTVEHLEPASPAGEADIDHVDRAAIPRTFERKRHDFPDTDKS
jgi:hypothetical protein